MLPGKYDLDLYRGDTRSWKFQLWSDDRKEVPVLLDGATAAAEFRDRPGGTSIVSFQCTITSPNIVEVTLFAEMWELAPDGGAWDLEITFLDGSIRTVLAGEVEVTADITHSDEATTFSVMSVEPSEPVIKRPVNLRSA